MEARVFMFIYNITSVIDLLTIWLMILNEGFVFASVVITSHIANY